MIGDSQEIWREALAKHGKLTERRVQNLMSKLEADGFHCERDRESKVTAIWIWPKHPIQEPSEGAAALDLTVDDTLAGYLKEQGFF